MRIPTKRSAAATAGVVMVLTLAVSSSALAADSFPPTGDQALGRAQPEFGAHRVQDIRDWSPETDPHAEQLRAQIPLQERIDPLAATQANPALDGKAEVMLMQGDYGNSFFHSTPYNNDYTENTLNFWQYVDYWSPWHGTATIGTPDTLYDPRTSDWRSRGFEFGIVNVPNPAYTNAAHRNGVQSIATIYFDPAFRPGLTYTEMFDADAGGEPTIANKLVEMAEYYGFDGYFLNQEEAGDDSAFKPLMAYLNEQGLYTQWYDTNSVFDASKAEWLRDEQNGRIHDSVFVNYDWPLYLDSSLDFIEENGYDPYAEVFMGVEANQGKFDGSHVTTRELTDLYAPGTKNPRTSVALFTPSDFYQRGLDDTVKIEGYDRPLMQTPDFQWMIQERERMYFSGVTEDPTDTGKKAGFARPDVGVDDASGWVGVADFTPARSVVDGTAFHSWFNTGHGMQYFDDGRVATDEQWANINIQSILPSWQWWMDSTASELAVDFDYGTELPRKDVNDNDIASPFIPVGAYNGGSSLVVHGDLEAKNTLRLFKTKLDVNASSYLDLTFRKTSTDRARMKLAVVLADDPGTVVELDVPHDARACGWTTSRVKLGKLAGRQIATIGLVFDGTTAGYQMNIGGIQVSDGPTRAPARPTGLSLDRVYDTGVLVVSWDAVDFSEVDQYNLYARLSDGRRVFLGGTYGDTFYVKHLFGEDDKATIELRAVGKDGTESKPAQARLNLQAMPSDLSVTEAMDAEGRFLQSALPDAVEVSWQAPSAGPKPRGYRVSVELRDLPADHPGNQVYSAEVPASATSATVDVPVGEGYEYDLSVQTIDRKGRAGEPISFLGRTHDSFAAPMPRSDIEVSGGRYAVSTPTPRDWYQLTVLFDGVEQFTATRGAGGLGADDPNEGLQLPRDLPAQDGTLTVILTDYAGNRSAPTEVTVTDGDANES